MRMQERQSSTLLGLLLSVALIVFFPVACLGQTVVGTIREWASENTVQGCRVVLLDDNEEEIAGAFTDEQGIFTLRPPSPGTYVLSITRIGYHPFAEGPVSVLAADTVEVSYEIRPVAVTLAPIVVRTVRSIRYLENAGFYERQRKENGFFLGPDEIEKRMDRASQVTDLLYGIPGLSVQRPPDGQVGSTVRLRGIRSLRGPCSAPKIYVDGILAYDPRGSGYVSMDELVNVEAINAIEIYRGPAELPAQYSGAESACGVLLIWTGRRD